MARFIGEVDTRWHLDGRTMTLLAPFAYETDELWDAPVCSEIDGASIPRPLWSIIGGPYEGLYRRASVVHDVACQTKSRPWKRTHRVFHEAMRTDGTGRIRALIMYAAVYHFGPRWGESERRTMSQAGDDRKRDAMRLRQYIEEHPDVTLDDVERLDPETLLRSVPIISARMTYPPEHEEQ